MEEGRRRGERKGGDQRKIDSSIKALKSIDKSDF